VFVHAGGSWTQQAYIKGSHVSNQEYFGRAVALSEDGGILVVGAPEENGAGRGVDATFDISQSVRSGAAYVFEYTTAWMQRVYLKSSNSDPADRFGTSVAIAGSLIAIGAPDESGSSSMIDGPDDNNANAAGAVFLFRREFAGLSYHETAYIKAPNPDRDDELGTAIALARDGSALLASSTSESSAGPASEEAMSDNSVKGAGAAYLFALTPSPAYEVYLKASNPGAFDTFGNAVALSRDATTLAVGAHYEDVSSAGIDGDQQARGGLADQYGAVYVFR
jgi:hypothetical protein